MNDLEELYRHRFVGQLSIRRDLIWQELARYLQRFVPADGRVLDVACDRGGFIRNVRAAERWAVDVRDVRDYLPDDVRFCQADALALATVVPTDYFDLVFMSNYLEHLVSAEAVVTQLRAVHDVLKPGGRVLVLQPNIRLVGGAYWDFLDHKTALTERSLGEAATAAGLVTRRVVARFLPYTTKARWPQHPALVRAYLRVPLIWRIVGRQTLFLAERPQ
jgi:SAM-dependent methyltransferase